MACEVSYFAMAIYDALVRLRDIGLHLLPRSHTSLQERYIGIGLVDYWLMVLQAVFANIFDDAPPKLSIYAFLRSCALKTIERAMGRTSCHCRLDPSSHFPYHFFSLPVGAQRESTMACLSTRLSFCLDSQWARSCKASATV